MTTLIYLAHRDATRSQSQSFLKECAQDLSGIEWIDLQSQLDFLGSFDKVQERQRLLRADRIIFQFPLIWYQAPAILKVWLDQVFDTDADLEAFSQGLKGKALGLCVTVGAAAYHYQIGGREGHSLSDILSPYHVLARHFKLDFLPPFVIHQFALKTDQEKALLAVAYQHYLRRGQVGQVSYSRFLLKQLQARSFPFQSNPTQALIFETFLGQLEDQIDEVDEMVDLANNWEED